MIDLSSLTSLLHEHREVVWWLVAMSTAIFVGSLIAVPWLVVRIPEDYFATRRRPKTQFANRHPLLRWTTWGIRNVLGAVLVLAGIAMLLLPGQGLLTMAVGVFLMDFPGKHRLERTIIRVGPVLKSINWLRRKAHTNPLHIEEDVPAPACDASDHDLR